MQVFVLSGHAEGVVLKWTLASCLVGFEVALAMEESVRECNPLLEESSAARLIYHHAQKTTVANS